ncbi:Protein Jade-3 [Dissostichus eleginoides]|uniref:Protein Jade-3 n=1 Tax=Dissostichus eleginoides TaxID=100907 RepID=A0AAD9CKA7_DISEL|nr:Protein Jade-3 [Dissostichus eleginoides]
MNKAMRSADSSDNESPSTSFGKPETPSPKKPAEVFRKYLISAMKLPDSHHVSVVRVGQRARGCRCWPAPTPPLSPPLCSSV